MPKDKTQLETAAGKLISAIQKEWGEEAGEPEAEESEEVMYKGHDLLAGANNILEVLNGHSVAQYLGEAWVKNHPSVISSINILEAEIISAGKNV